MNQKTIAGLEKKLNLMFKEHFLIHPFIVVSENIFFTAFKAACLSSSFTDVGIFSAFKSTIFF